jgi:outer membrane protein TolC
MAGAGLGTEDIQFGQQFGLDLTVPIFSGGRLSAQQRQARRSLRQRREFAANRKRYSPRHHGGLSERFAFRAASGSVGIERERVARTGPRSAQSGRRPTLDFNISNLLRSPVTFLGRSVVQLGVAGAGTLFSSGRVASQVAEAKALVEGESGRLQGDRINVAERIARAFAPRHRA